MAGGPCGSYLRLKQGNDIITSFEATDYGQLFFPSFGLYYTYMQKGVYSTFVATEEVQSSSRLLLKPNPANNTVEVSADWPLHENITLAIYNTLCQVRYLKELLPTAGKAIDQVDVSNFEDGVYFVMLRSETMQQRAALVVRH